MKLKERIVTIRELIPEEGMHIKHKESGDIYEGSIFLGVEDKQENYEEVTEQEYQEYLTKKNSENA